MNSRTLKKKIGDNFDSILFFLRKVLDIIISLKLQTDNSGLNNIEVLHPENSSPKEPLPLMTNV